MSCTFTIKLTVTGDQTLRKTMFEAIKDNQLGTGSIDFNKVTPMPESVFRGDLGKEEMERYGKNNWFDWSMENWGSDREFCSCEEELPAPTPDSDCLMLETNGAFPDLVFATLATQYPALRFEVKWTTEDYGDDVGHVLYENGKLTKEVSLDAFSEEAVAISAEILGEDNDWDDDDDEDTSDDDDDDDEDETLNHVLTVLTITGDQNLRDVMLEFIKQDWLGIGSVDFNKIIPMPKNLSQSNEKKEARGYDENWIIKNWGAKWNGCSCCNSCNYGRTIEYPAPDSTQISFLTDKNFPGPVICALAAEYPDLRFEAKWAGKNIGHNVGRVLYEKGNQISMEILNDESIDAVTLATEIHGKY